MTHQKQAGGSCLFPREEQGSLGLWLDGHMWPLLVEGSNRCLGTSW